ncbi:hypothetical protein [[Clostridium] fimetarium]|uniref:Guanylate cyclase domain-containing protein n=1 Tax=[Clostridium] fimetarium TaxID=99656 RepID=A0A1I0Q011_9FIRM|nr:hypothetical protein [[Clostridium] fimetarium]SEW20201.1 hypothetical protein SAMN05421659_106180 [[Clostridium] fimetarium]
MMVNENKDSYDRKTDTYIVAYFDLLGVTSRIKSDMEKQEVFMNKLHNLYTFSMNLTREIKIKENKEIQFKIFSDNIIIAKKISEENRLEDINCLLSCAAHFQELAASDSVGWMLRGGITIGQLFIDEVMVWGEALVKSYFLEDKVAIYPRVILDSNVISEIKNDSVLSEYMRKDFDDLMYLNYLNNCYYCGERLMKGFELMKEELESHWDERMRQKFSWHMNYINSELDRKKEKKDKKYRLTLTIL